MKKILISLGIVIAVVGIYVFKLKEERKYTKTFFYMDTVIKVDIYTNKNGDDILEEVVKIYEKYHTLSDRYTKYDNINNIYVINNELDINEEIVIQKELYDILSYSQKYFDKTDKRFNIALGNVIDIWKKYQEKQNGVPTYEELTNSGSINLDSLVLLEDNKIKKTSDIKLDLGSISKGYTTQVVGDYLKSIGVVKYLINAGGNVLVGEHYQNSKYKIGLENPLDNTDIYKVIKANNKAIVTSGSYARNYEYNGVVYHHIIDNQTLFPPQDKYSVTVITNNSAYADILSTYLFVIGYEEGLKFVENNDDVEAIWYLKDKIYTSSGIASYE